MMKKPSQPQLTEESASLNTQVTDSYRMLQTFTDKIWYMAKGHPKVGWAPSVLHGFAVAAPCTNLPKGIVFDVI